MSRQQAAGSRQLGLSMIELLVALALSSILILGITQIYIDNKRSYIFQQSQVVNLNSARFADLLLSDLLGKASYQRTTLREKFPTENLLSDECANFGDLAVTQLESGDEVGFCLRYHPAVDGELTCAGNRLTMSADPFEKPVNSELAYIALKFEPNDDDLENGVISCIDTVSGRAELITGVADFRIDFGVYRSPSEDIQEWMSASDWAPSDGPVHALRYSILLASARNQRDGDSAVFQRWIEDPRNAERKEPLVAGDSRRIYQIATGSQALRNLNL